jgi:hypothetical protein
LSEDADVAEEVVEDDDEEDDDDIYKINNMNTNKIDAKVSFTCGATRQFVR